MNNAVLTVWWAILKPFNPIPETEQARYLWGGIYQIMAYWGGINGLLIAIKWGGKNRSPLSFFGRSGLFRNDSILYLWSSIVS